MKNKYFKAGIGYTIGNFLLKGIAFLTTPLFARLLSIEEYGKYSIFIAYESILLVILGCAIHSSYKNAFSKFHEADSSDASEIKYQKYRSVTVLFLIVSFLIWILLVILVGHCLTGFLGLDICSIYLLVCFSFASSVYNCFSSDTGLHYEYQRYLKTSILNAILSTVLSLLLTMTFFKENMYLGRILGMTVPYFVISIIIAIYYFLQASPRGMMKELKWGLHYSLPIVPHGLSQIVLLQFDRIMIRNMVGSHEAGLYSFAYTIYSVIATVSSSIDGVWQPWFYEKRREEEYESIRQVSLLYILVLFAICFLIIPFSPELILVLGGGKYRESIYCVIPIVFGGFFSCAYNIPCVVEYYHEKTKSIAVATICAAVLNTALNFCFIPKFGYIAAAYTTLVTYILYFVFHYFISIRVEGKSLFLAKPIVFSVFGLFFVSTFSVLCIDKLILRWTIGFVFLVIILCIEEKQFGVITRKLFRRKR